MPREAMLLLVSSVDKLFVCLRVLTMHFRAENEEDISTDAARICARDGRENCPMHGTTLNLYFVFTLQLQQLEEYRDGKLSKP